MARRSLADELFGILPDCKGVSSVKEIDRRTGTGKKKVKIVRGEGEVFFTVTEPDYPIRTIGARTTDVVTAAWQVEQFLKKEGVVYSNK